LAYDRGLKLELYARHGIPEVWVANLAAQGVEVFRAPHEGDYSSRARVGGSSTLEIAALPGVSIPAHRIFGTGRGPL
jgi:Uma2 family endonuclease